MNIALRVFAVCAVCTFLTFIVTVFVLDAELFGPRRVDRIAQWAVKVLAVQIAVAICGVVLWMTFRAPPA